MNPGRTSTRRAGTAALPIFILAALFLCLGVGMRLSGWIESVRLEELTRIQNLEAGLDREFAARLLETADAAQGLRLDRAEQPLGATGFPVWNPLSAPEVELPLAAAQAVVLSDRGEHEAAWGFFQHPSTAGVEDPTFLRARIRSLAALEGKDAARAAILALEPENIADDRGLPFPLVAAILMKPFDKDEARRLLRNALDRALRSPAEAIPCEAVEAVAASVAELGLEDAVVDLWTDRARAVAQLRRSGLQVEPGRVFTLGRSLAIGAEDAIVLRTHGDLVDVVSALEREHRETGSILGLDPLLEPGAGFEAIALAPRIERTSEDLELISVALIAGAAVIGLLGGWSSLRFARREARLAELKSDFVDLVSHELRTPLTILGLKTEMLATNSVPAAKRDSYLRDLDTEVGKLKELVNGLLDFSRLEKGRLVIRDQEVELRRLLAEVLGSVRRRHRRLHQKIEVEVPRRPILIQGDEEALARSILNLLDNAAKYAGEGATVKLGVELEDQALRLVVADDGPGVPVELRGRLFEKFSRGHHSGITGSGLGLALVQATALAHGGQVELDARTDRGARFVMKLPRSEKA